MDLSAFCFHATVSGYLLAPISFIWLVVWLAFTRFWPLSPLILASYWWVSIRPRPETRFGTRNLTFANLGWWNHVRAYVKGGMEYNGPKLDTSRRYLFCIHPHGVLALDRFLFLSSRLQHWDRCFPGIDTRDLSATAMFFLPGVREFNVATGCVVASKKVAERILRDPQRGSSLLLYPGGEKEQILTEEGKDRVFLKTRKGFIKLALENGAPIVPCYVFGTVNEYHTSMRFFAFRKRIQEAFSIAIPLCWGKLPFWWVPLRVPVHAVFGEPIEVPKVDSPSDDQINEYHSIYIERLTKIFEDNKTRFEIPASTHLEVC